MTPLHLKQKGLTPGLNSSGRIPRNERQQLPLRKRTGRLGGKDARVTVYLTVFLFALFEFFSMCVYYQLKK